uniref:E3 ubiquitin-protein ligase UBR5-like n=1 Tax=Phallusia mammillata TaxID=59560 RepID=A0A6F9DWS3_9ASCI|nr:E3 ubiquitin-protein ligase UBR5-like [Phallusia mammillata]
MKSFVSNLQFVVQPISKGNKDFLDEEEKFQEKLLQLSENIFSCNVNDTSPAVQLLQQYSIKDCVVGPDHIVFLLDDGRVCRLGYTASILSPHSQKQNEEQAKDKSHQNRSSRSSKSMRTDDSPWNLDNANLLNMSSDVSWTRWGNRIGVIRSTASTSTGSSSTTASSSTRKTARMSLNSAAGIAGSNIRLIRSGQVRGRNLPLLSGQRVVLPASHVPEDLINQVQGVLQGKSRNLIVRELQRTNLDVNLAVNNLLSRDDEENDDLDDAGDYIPGEELMSLLDGGMHPGDHPRVVIDADAMLPEDLLGYSFSGRPPPSSRGLGGGGSGNSDRQNDPDDDNLTRMNSPHWIDLFRKIDSKRQPKLPTVPPPGSSGISLSEDIEWWVNDNGEAILFKLIGGMHSELVAVDNSCVLRQWKWKSKKPFNDGTFHPRSKFLNLENHKISMLATCSLRASIVTEGGAMATWMDESVSCHTMSLDQPCSAMDVIEMEVVKSLHVCPLYSAVLTQQGRVYWWGVLPFNQRKKILEKSQNSLLQNLSKENAPSSKPDLAVGTHVCLRHFPIYHAGAVAVNISTGTPKMGMLLESVWDLEKKAKFQIINDKTAKPETHQAPDNSTVEHGQDNSATTSLSDTSKSHKRKRSQDEDVEEADEAPHEEEWDLQKVVFIEDIRTIPIGKVTKIDGNIVAVQFSSSDEKSQESAEASSSLSSCRLLHKDDIVVVKSSLPRVVDCVQKTPRRLACDPRLHLHCINATTNGIAAVGNKPGEKLSYLRLSISMGRVLAQKVLPTKVESFVDPNDQNGQMNTTNQNKTSTPIPDFTADTLPTQIQKASVVLNRDQVQEVLGLNSSWSPIPVQSVSGKKAMFATQGLVDSGLLDMQSSANTSASGSVDAPINQGKVVHKWHSHVKGELRTYLIQKLVHRFFPTSDMMPINDNRLIKLLGFAHRVEKSCYAGANSKEEYFHLLAEKIHKIRKEIEEKRQKKPVAAAATAMAMCVDLSKEASTSVATNSMSKCKLLNCSQECPTLLQDYNAMLYPLLADENDGIRDPIWADIPPLLASGMGIHSVDADTRYTVTVLAFQNQVLMPLVLRRDFPAFEALIKSIETNPSTTWLNVFYKSLLDERCDGQRNLLHMCIEMSIPSSNKEQKEDEKEKDSKKSPAPKTVPESPARPNPGEPKPLMSTSPAGGLFMSDSDHADAVNAIANAISAVTRGPASGGPPDESPSRAPIPVPGSSPPVPPTQFASGPWGIQISEVHPPGSPILTWPPELPTWKNDGQQEEGINLTVPSSSDKKKNRSSSTWSEGKGEGKDRGTRWDAVSILKLICNSKCIQPHLKKLLTQKDTAGYTPFMFAVAHRAYPAALILFTAAINVAKETVAQQDKDVADKDEIGPEHYKQLLSMIYPSGSNADDNPLYMLCCNDTCTFTWTGAQHINQDIFECLTCGLTETLCCCTECARVCHKGHDCKLKRTSPTAYCDCWEKCACKSLVAGDNNDRMALLRNLLHLTDLYEIHNSSGQHILHFLIQTVVRQLLDQRQWRPPQRSSRMNVPPSRAHRMGRSGAKSPTQSGEQDMPEHDLHPPRFCREALLQLLSDWKAVRSLIMGGDTDRRDKLSVSFRLDSKDQSGSGVPLLPEDEELLQQQSGTARLDMFTHTLLIKSASYEYMDKLLETLIHTVQLNKGVKRDEGIMVARRFLRSVIRVFVVLTAQSTPDKISSKSSFYNQPTSKCRRAFLALTPIAVEELCEMAEALIAPVRMGVSRPTTSYSLLSHNMEVVHGSTTAFSKMPFPPRSTVSDDDSGRPGPSGGGVGKQVKKSSKSKKKSKRNTVLSRRYGSGRARSRRSHVGDGEHEDDNAGGESDHMETSQETSSTALAQDTGDEDQGADSERNESDMDLTDIELLAESDSDSLGSDDSKLLRDYMTTPRDREQSHDQDDDDDEEEYDTEPVNDDGGDAKSGGAHQEDEDTDSDHPLVWHDENTLERQATRQLRAESRQAPHTMQWAMGSSSMIPVKPPRSGNGAGGGGSRVGSNNLGSSSSNSGIIYVDRGMRRSDNLENVYINSILDRHYGPNRVKHAEEPRVNSSSVTNAQLARLFATCIREVSHLLAILKKGDYLSEAPLSTVLEVSFKEASDLQTFVKSFMEKTWNWLLTVVESTEYQLRYGQILTMASSPTHKDHPHHKSSGGSRDNRRSRDTSRHPGSSNFNEDAKQDFFSYVLSLMRSHSNEHSDLLPIVDVAALKHVAYVLDAYIYYMRGLSFRDADDMKNSTNSRNQISLDIGYDNSENEDEEDDDFSFHDDLYSVAIQSDPVSLRVNTNIPTEEDLNLFSQPPASFFHRSESMTFLGSSDSNPFDVPLPVALPLAEKPHILQPSARKEELFGRLRSSQSQQTHQVSSMSLSHRSSSSATDKDEDDARPSTSGKTPAASSSGNVDPPEHPHPPPPYSSVIRSTSSLNPPIVGDGGEAQREVVAVANAENVPMDTIQAPGAAVTVDVTSSESEPGPSGNKNGNSAVVESVLGKCRLTLELFSRVFLDDVGNEPKSILQELGGFEVREAKFRKDMERIRTSQTVDLQLNVERSRDPLIQQTFKNLNQHFKRRCGSSQPMAVLRVKVLFKDEPGEGTGVARSFYTAISEALLSSDPLPSLDGLIPGSASRKGSAASSVNPLMAQLCKRSQDDRGRSGTTSSNPGGRHINLRSFLTARYRDRGPRRGFSSGASVTPMSTNAAPFYRRSSSQRSNQSSLERSKHAIGERLFPKVLSMHSAWAPKVTGMLLGLPAYELLLLLRSERTLQDRVSEAIDQLLSSGYRAATGQRQSPSSGESRNETNEPGSGTGESRQEPTGESTTDKPPKSAEKDASSCAQQAEEQSGGPPLFYQPGKRGFYSPTSWGEMNEARLNAFRNVGRILGLCLLQNELCPLPLCRHVLKVILGRKVNWHDLAFFDPTLYESLRQLVVDAESDDGGVLEDLELTFVADLQSEESGRQVSLIADGAMTPVTKSNVRDYVRRYALHRMIVCCRKPLEKIRQGVYDVLPRYTLQSLTAEDLRLLVNGCGHVDLRTLISYTLFNDESGKSGSAEKLVQFKRWFWAVVDRLSSSDKQELLYFWTGSPALPASEDGFQPMPTITIRPPDDQHLPTANTCISRLYVPLYSTRQILKQKLSVAIKTKNFGFV